MSGVRTRLAKAGVPGLTKEEVGEPAGNAQALSFSSLLGFFSESGSLCSPGAVELPYTHLPGINLGWARAGKSCPVRSAPG